MSEWVTVAGTNEVPFNGKERFRLSEISLIIVNLDGEFYAVEDRCSHDGGNLSDGWLEHGELVCPRHGAHFCPKTGEALTPPAYEPINSYPVKIEEGRIKVKID